MYNYYRKESVVISFELGYNSIHRIELTNTNAGSEPFFTWKPVGLKSTGLAWLIGNFETSSRKNTWTGI